MSSLQLNINFQQLLEIIKQLTPAEKTKLNEFIWNEDMEVLKEHQEIVQNRRQKSKENPSRMQDWDEASKNLIS